MANKVNINLGCGNFLVPLVFLILLIAKLKWAVDISWWVVCSPLIIYAIICLLFIITGIFVLRKYEKRPNRDIE